MSKKMWTVKDILAYAIEKYSLFIYEDIEGRSPDKSDINAYERVIRRTMAKNSMVEKNEKTGKYNYVVTEKIGKYIVDILLHSYFSERSNGEKVKNKFLERDAELNDEAPEVLLEIQSDIEQDTPVYWDRMNESIIRLMIYGVFNLYYDFNEAEYKKDFVERERLINNDDLIQKVQNGYSELNHKLSNPLRYYCSRKK